MARSIIPLPLRAHQRFGHCARVSLPAAVRWPGPLSPSRPWAGLRSRSTEGTRRRARRTLTPATTGQDACFLGKRSRRPFEDLGGAGDRDRPDAGARSAPTWSLFRRSRSARLRFRANRRMLLACAPAWNGRRPRFPNPVLARQPGRRRCSYAIATAVVNGQIISWLRRRSVSSKRPAMLPTSSQRLLGRPAAANPRRWPAPAVRGEGQC